MHGQYKTFFLTKSFMARCSFGLLQSVLVSHRQRWAGSTRKVVELLKCSSRCRA
jgi:hypothetical protein